MGGFLPFTSLFATPMTVAMGDILPGGDFDERVDAPARAELAAGRPVGEIAEVEARLAALLAHGGGLLDHTTTRLREIVEATPDYVVTTRPDGHVIYANAAARELFGVTGPDEIAGVGVNLLDHYTPESQQRLRDEAFPEVRASGLWVGDLAVDVSDGATRFVSQVIVAHHDDDGAIECISGIARDITEQKLLAAELARQATYDRLTKLAGRALLVDRLEHCMQRSRRTREQFAVLFCDLDGFKLVNDVLGHEAGDKVLVEVSRRLQELVRGHDTVARFGGDEFVVLLEDIHTIGNAFNIAQRIVEELSEPITLGDSDATIGVSIGIASSDSRVQAVEQVLAQADAAMYEAKRRGKGRVEFFGRELDRRLADRRELGGDLRHAIARDELALHYRPVASLETGDITSLEASMRWHHPARGALTPNDFVAIAAATGLIETIDQWTLTSAARQIAEWRSAHADLVVWTTVSGRLLMRGDGASRILSMLTDVGARAGSLGIEIGEQFVADNFDESVVVLRELHDGGVRVALDNFSGRLPAPQLQDLRPDTIKLDRSFVARLGVDIEAARAVRSITGMTRPLGISIVAKGVDTTEQLAAVISLNFDGAQGTVIGGVAPAVATQFARRELGNGAASYLPIGSTPQLERRAYDTE